MIYAYKNGKMEEGHIIHQVIDKEESTFGNSQFFFYSFILNFINTKTIINFYTTFTTL